jgi:conjugal transfer pilus assembly protein TraU
LISWIYSVLTELDPTWNDDLVAAYMNPEATLFGSPISQAVCASDCISATAGFPLDPLFWCAGCWGDIYPFSGTVPYSNGGVDSSSLLSVKMIAKLNRLLLEGVTTLNYCQTIPTGFIKKSQYKLQLLYPKASKQCVPLGRSTMIWERGKPTWRKGRISFIFSGERRSAVRGRG